MNLELKHLAPYLPYGLKIKTRHEASELVRAWNEGITLYVNMKEGASFYNDIYPDEFKPILRPLSDLTPRYADAWGISSLKHLIRYIEKKDVPMHIYLELLEGHFDVFGLIDNDLAIDINTINS